MSRSAKEFRRIYGSKERVEFVQGLPCATCGKASWEDEPSQNSHIYSGGTAYKENYTKIIPQCPTTMNGEGCHAWFGRDPAGFMEAKKLTYSDLEDMALRTESMWKEVSK